MARTSTKTHAHRSALVPVGLAGAALSLALLGGCGPTEQVPDASQPTSPDASTASTQEVDSTAFIPDASTEIERFDEQGDTGEKESESTSGTAVTFRPADTGIQEQPELSYPYLGLTAKLPQSLQDAMASRDVFAFAQESYTDDWTAIRYAHLVFCALTDEQKTREVSTVDPEAWRSELRRIGTLGAYEKAYESQLDDLTGCDEHTKLGESPDGAYVYYLSTSSQASPDEITQLTGIETTISAMRELDPSDTLTAFSVGRIEGVSSVGDWTTTDVEGAAIDSRELFGSAKLTLVNVLTTWCPSCVEEMPELEQLRATMEQSGVNVVGVVLDTVTEKGNLDEWAVEQAQRLKRVSGVQFPLIVPDASEMNGRLTGIESFPESFLVDSEGNIVGKTYAGARTFEGWKQVIEQELAALEDQA
ncbi:MAG: TlpA family protein disulfide reductase [Coriobacteriia bacterium]|nr:TlpA family protein disulfide reductase [Coriobacteriia bacterium]MBS5477187.1 TlpA family protein disulfide reductase [Coriobacteriia bacterium]